MARTPHIDYEQFQLAASDAQKCLIGLSKAVDASGLDKRLTELVKLRVSFMNGCAFCTALHQEIARKVGVDGVKIDLVAVWRDVDVFTDRERAALAWSEHLTRMSNEPIPEQSFEELRAHFSEPEAIQLTITVATINAWNRISGGLRFPTSQASVA